MRMQTSRNVSLGENVAANALVSVRGVCLVGPSVAVVLVSWLLCMMVALPESSWGNGAELTQAEAISIATKELRKMGYRTRGLRAHVDENNAGWNNYVEMSTQLAAPETMKHFEGIKSALADRSFVNVTFSVKSKPNQAVFGGISVFLDSKIGEVLIVMTHRETIIKAPGKK